MPDTAKIKDAKRFGRFCEKTLKDKKIVHFDVFLAYLKENPEPNIAKKYPALDREDFIAIAESEKKKYLNDIEIKQYMSNKSAPQNRSL